MSFDFFNPSDLAFGQKLTAAFIALNNLADASDANLNNVFDDLAYYQQYIGRSYQIARPTKPDDPCRTNELLNILNDKPIFIKELKVDKKTMTLEIIAYNTVSNRITRAKGSTKLRKGYAYFKPAISINQPEREITFTSDVSYTDGEFILEFRIDEANKVNISGSVTNLGLIPFDAGQYTKIKIGKVLALNNARFTADNYICVCVIGKVNNADIKLNGVTILKGIGERSQRHAIVYLKPDDVISGTYDKIYQVVYS